MLETLACLKIAQSWRKRTASQCLDNNVWAMKRCLEMPKPNTLVGLWREKPEFQTTVCPRSLSSKTSLCFNILDIILVTIGFYVGDEKADVGRLPFALLGAISAGAMILSEVKKNMPT